MAEDTGRRVMQNRRRQRILRKSGGAGQKIMSYADLEVGDYVVHANYGIGRFEGMQSVRVDGVTRDYTQYLLENGYPFIYYDYAQISIQDKAALKALRDARNAVLAKS